MSMPKNNPKHNSVHMERVNRKRAKNVAPIPKNILNTDLNQLDEISVAPPSFLPHEATRRGSGFRAGGRRCGLCGKTTNLTKTECCNQWICDDEDQYAMFSYDTNSCHRNHGRYTLCAYHHEEGHAGRWQDCPKCRKDLETEMYVWYGTNEYNFEKLPNPPAFKPTRCAKCHKIIHLGEEGYTVEGNNYFCENCGDLA